MKKAVVLVMVLSLFAVSMPYHVFAAEQNLCMQAEKDVEKDTNKVLWWGAGFLCGIFGVGAGYLMTPAVPAERLTGKSSSYVQQYTSCYQAAAKNMNGLMALTGCALSVAIGSLIFTISTL